MGSVSRSPRIYCLPPGASYLTTVARGLRTYLRNERDLSHVTLFLPNRRSATHLSEALVSLAPHKVLLMPHFKFFGTPEDTTLEADPRAMTQLDQLPALSPLRRLLELTPWCSTLAQFHRPDGKKPSLLHAIGLAQALAEVLDELILDEKQDLDFASFTPHQQAVHWELALKFLDICQKAWPKRLAHLGMTEPRLAIAAQLAREQSLLAEKTEEGSLPDPVLAIGSSGADPAVARLLLTIAQRPNGAVLLPPFDPELNLEFAQKAPRHAYHGIANFLGKAGCTPDQVQLWPPGLEPGLEAGASRRSPRLRVLCDAMAPVPSFPPASFHPAWTQGLERITMLACPDEEAEATSIALLLRQTLGEPGKTAALVTGSPELVRRVVALLGRFGVKIEVSAGMPLSETPLGRYLILVAEFLAQPGDIHAFLGLMKQSFVRCKQKPRELKKRIHRLEREWRLKEPPSEAADLWPPELREFREAQPVLTDKLEDNLVAVLEFAECLAQSEPGAEPRAEPGAGQVFSLWDGALGVQMSQFLSSLLNELEAVKNHPALEGDVYRARGEDFPAFLVFLLQQVRYYPKRETSERIQILGPLEARLLRFDRAIIGGLNDGPACVFPPRQAADRLLSGSIRQAAGLNFPERKMGLVALDFIQIGCSPELFLTRALRERGETTLPAPFWLRMELLAQKTGKELQDPERSRWRETLETTRAPARTGRLARPTPPLAHRKKVFSPSTLELLIHNPYGFHAREHLGLRCLPPLMDALSPSKKGQRLHGLMESFLQDTQKSPKDPAALRNSLEAHLQQILERLDPLNQIVLEAAFRASGEKFIDWLLALKTPFYGVPVFCEKRVFQPFTPDRASFELSAIYDLVMKIDDTIYILDFKTGYIPTHKQIHANFKPQLLVQALVLTPDNFPELDVASSRLQIGFWKFGLSRETSAYHARLEDQDKKSRAIQNLFRHIEAYLTDATLSYPIRPYPQLEPQYDDYLHLSRWQRNHEAFLHLD